MTNAAADESAMTLPAIGRRELEAAHEIARAFLATTQPIEVYRLALARLAPVVRADFAAVFLRDESDPETLRPVCLHGWPQSSARYIGLLRIRVGRGPTGRAVADNVAVEVTDVFADPAYSDWWEPARELGFASLITVPLATHLGVSGAVTFYFGEPRIFSDDERRLLRLISEHLASTSLRARIVEDLRAENDRLRARAEKVLATARRTKSRSDANDQLIASVTRGLHDTLSTLKTHIEESAKSSVSGSGATFLAESAVRTLADVGELMELRLGRARLNAAPEDAIRLARLAIETAGPAPQGATFELIAADTIIPITTDARASVRALATLLNHAFARNTRGSVTLRVDQTESEEGLRVTWYVNVRGIGLEAGATSGPGATLEMTLADELAATLGGSIKGWTDPAEGYTLSLSLPSRRG